MLGNIGSAFTVAFAVTPLMMYLCELKEIFKVIEEIIFFFNYFFHIEQLPLVTSLQQELLLQLLLFYQK